MSPRYERPIFVGRDPSEPISGRTLVRMGELKKDPAASRRNRTTQAIRINDALKKLPIAARRAPGVYRRAKLTESVLTVLAAGVIAWHNRSIQTTTHQPHETMPTQHEEITFTPSSNIEVEEGITIVPGLVEIDPGVNLRTSPHIDKSVSNIAKLPANYRGKKLLVYNPRMVLGMKADSLTRTSSDRSQPYQDPWILFKLEEQDIYVNVGPATAGYVNMGGALEPVSVRRVKQGTIVYYEGPQDQGYAPGKVEIAAF